MATEQKAQKVVREKGQTTCVYHKGHSLIMYCETCSDVMCMKCLSGLHKGHFVCDLNEVIPSMKTELQSYLNKNNRAQIQKGIDSTENEKKTTLNNYDSLCREVKTQSVKLKQAIDIKTEKVLEFCKQLTEGNIKTLTCSTKELQSQLKCFDDNLQQEYTEVLKHGSSLQVHDTLGEVRSRSNVPLMPILATASFHPNTNPHSYMDRYFGTITSSAYRPLQYTFLPNTIELSTFHLNGPKQIQAICASTEDEAWVLCQYEFKLINTNGHVQQTVPWELPAIDASVSPTTKNLWVCSDRSVYELDVSTKSPASLQKTAPTIRNTTVTCLCVTLDDQVIVGNKRQITKYTKDGRVVITTQARQSGQPLVPCPRKIAECCVTRNVAVLSSILSSSNIYDTSTNTSSVVVMDQDFEKLFEQSREIPGNERVELNIKPHENMRDLQYDTAGNLIICCESYLHVLSGRGEFLKAIVTQPHSQNDPLMPGMEFGFALYPVGDTCLVASSLDTDGVLWAGCDLRHQNKKAVKRLQYCKQNVV